jgi:hypothetical protein
LGISATLVGSSVIVALGTASFVALGSGVAVKGGFVGKGEIGTVAVGGGDFVEVGITVISAEFSAHPERKNTNKVNNITLDKFNVIKGPFVTP